MVYVKLDDVKTFILLEVTICIITVEKIAMHFVPCH